MLFFKCRQFEIDHYPGDRPRPKQADIDEHGKFIAETLCNISEEMTLDCPQTSHNQSRPCLVFFLSSWQFLIVKSGQY
jgi:hypothetical protein